MQTVVLLVLAHFFVPADFGVLAIAALTYNVVQALNNLGIADALTYREERVHEAARTALTMIVGVALALTVATWFAAPAIASFFHSPRSVFVLRGFAVAIPFDAAALVPVALMTRSLQFRRRTLPDAVPAVVGGAVTIAVVAAGHDLGGLVAGQIVQGVVMLVIALAVGYRCLPGWDGGLARELFSYGGHLGAAAVMQLVLLNIDYIIVGHVLGPNPLGYYSLAYRLCYMPYLAVSFVVNGAAFPYYCRLPSRQDIGRATETVSALVNAASVPLYAGLVLFANDVVLLGHKWAPAVPAIRWLAVYGLFLSVINSLQAALKAVGRPSLVLASRTLHLVVLASVLGATASYGITVVSFDQAVVALGVMVVTAVWTVRNAAVRPLGLASGLALPLLGAAAMTAVVLLGRLIPALSEDNWTGFVVLGLCSLAAFGAVIMAVMPATIRQGWTLLRGSGGPEAVGRATASTA
jgi:O-antigen/teichoic acid export membrane protein